MAKRYYLPKAEPELVTWFNNYAAKVNTHGTTVGMTAGEKTQAGVDAVNVALCVNSILAYKDFLANWTEFKRIMLYAPLNTPIPGVPPPPTAPTLAVGSLAAIVARTQQIDERIRNHAAYTLAIGQDLGIIGADESPDTHPTNIKAHQKGNSVISLTFSKGDAPGVMIWSKRGSEVAWSFLAVDTNSPYVDERAPLVANQPETRTYRLKLYDGDGEYGDFSDEVSVVTIP